METLNMPAFLVPILFLLLSSVSGLLLAQSVAGLSGHKLFEWLIRSKRVVVANLLLINSLQLPLLAIFNHYGLAFSLTLFLIYLVARVDRVKYENALTHFLWSDLFKSSDPGRFTELVSHYVKPAVFVPITAVLFAGNIFLIIFPRYPFPAGLSGLIVRVSASLAGLIGMYLLADYGRFAFSPFNRRWAVVPDLTQFDYDRNYRVHGTLLGFAAHIRLVATEQDRPDTYSPAAAESIASVLNAAAPGFIPAGSKTSKPPAPGLAHEHKGLSRRPTLIILAVEALWDVSRFGNLTYPEDPFAAFRKDYQGDVQASCFAGLTANSEFEFLTSFSMQNMHDCACPFIHLKHSVPALPAQLKELGYQTTAIHSFTRTFYNRDQIYPALGFDQFLGLEELEQQGLRQDKGWYMSDESLISAIERQLNASDQPQLIYVLTMQNHGPYSTDRYEPGQMDHASTPVFPDTFLASAGDRRAIVNYTQGLLDSGKLYSAVKALLKTHEKPAWVLTFGDHLPGLGENSGYRLYLENGLADDVYDPNLYRVPWCLWSNQTDNLTGSIPVQRRGPIRFNALAPLLLQAAGLPLSPIQQFVAQMDHAAQTPTQAQEEQNRIWQEAYAWLQYDWLWGANYIQSD